MHILNAHCKCRLCLIKPNAVSSDSCPGCITRKRSSCGWSTRQGGWALLPAVLLHARCVTYSKSRILCSCFLFGENDDDDVFSQQHHEYPLTYICKCFSFLTGNTLWILLSYHHCSVLTRVHQTNFSPAARILITGSIRNDNPWGDYKATVQTSQPKENLEDFWEQHLSRPALHLRSGLVSSVTVADKVLKSTSSSTMYVFFFYANLMLQISWNPLLSCLLVWSTGHGKMHPMHLQTQN